MADREALNQLLVGYRSKRDALVARLVGATGPALREVEDDLLRTHSLITAVQATLTSLPPRGLGESNDPTPLTSAELVALGFSLESQAALISSTHR